MELINLIWTTTIGSLIASGIILLVIRTRNEYLKNQEELRDNGFGFYIEYEKGKDLVALDLKNIGKNELSIDPKKGIYIKYKKDNGEIECHGLDLHENNISSIPKGRSRQLNYYIKLNFPQKKIIESKKFRVFIFTTRDKEFELHPADVQLKKWDISLEGWKEIVKDIPKHINCIDRLIIRIFKKWFIRGLVLGIFLTVIAPKIYYLTDEIINKICFIK
jgi:hypothetical protein